MEDQTVQGGKKVKRNRSKELKERRWDKRKGKTPPLHHLSTPLKRWSQGVYERQNKNVIERSQAGREKDYLSPLLTQWDDNAF